MDELRGKIGLAPALTFGKINVPPALRRPRRAALLQQQEMPRRQFLDPCQDRVTIGDIAPCHIGLNRLRADPAAQQRVREQALQFRGKGDAAVRQVRQKQRLHPKAIPRQK